VIAIAQTNLQLYNQLLEQGRSLEDLALIRSAYKLASLLYSGYYQGDGKPFVCHGIGVASIAARLDLPAEFVAVGLIHNIYGNGDFGDAIHYTVTERRRRFVQAAMGDRVAVLTERFQSVRINSMNVDSMTARLVDLDSTDRNLLILDLADALEKYVDLGVLYFGDGQWIKEATENRGARLIDIATRLNQPMLAEMLSEAFAFAADKQVPSIFQQADQKYLELVVPLSCYQRRWPAVREEVRRRWQKLRALPGRLTVPFRAGSFVTRLLP
jgi:(p)ppGpp synthase/HD superfamily hydrolase